MELTRETANIFFTYKHDTGKLIRNHVDSRWYKSESACKRDNNLYSGNECGFIFTDSTGKKYRKVKFKGKAYFVHNIIWFIAFGKFPNGEIDHIDGDGLNNKIKNLRDVTHAENGKNMRKTKANKSGFTGVSWHKASRSWVSQIRVDGKPKHLGCFQDINDAIEARKKANIIYGYHKNHGS